jgi:ubiquinone biosynthesis protein
MHPGNIFVQVDDPEKPRYAAVDFGIVGTLSPDDQQYLAGNFLAFFDRDYHKIAKLHLDSGWVPADTRIDELEAAVRAVCEPIFNKPLSEISFAQVMIRLFETARHFNMEIQPQLILLQKTLFNIEGLGRELYPQLDLWKTAHPILRRWMEEQVGARAMLDRLREDLPQVRDALRDLPGVIRSLSEQISRGDLKLNLQSPELKQIRDQLRKQQRQRYWLAVGATAIITGTLILTWGFLPSVAWTLIAAGIFATIAGRPRS